MSDETAGLVRYRVGPVTIDGPPLAIGQEAAFRIFGDVGPAEIVAGVPTFSFRVRDWAGPWLEQRNVQSGLPIAEHVLSAAASAVRARGEEIDPGGDYADVARDLARAAIEAVARWVRPTDDEATAMALGVMRLDVEKLTETGDRMAAMLASHEELVARWRGVAHGDWAKHHALRRAAGETAP